MEATATDPGSDDLGFKWSFQPTTAWYNNDGTIGTSSTDPCPSPDGVYPFSAVDIVSSTYNGPETITLTVEDDDGEIDTTTIDLN